MLPLSLLIFIFGASHAATDESHEIVPTHSEFDNSNFNANLTDCDFYALDSFSQNLITHLSFLSPSERHLSNDTEGAIVARNVTIANLNPFYRLDLSTPSCADSADVRVKIPLTFHKPLTVTFAASPNLPLKTWVNVTATVGTLELDAVFDVDYLGTVENRKVRLVSVAVTSMEDTQLGLPTRNTLTAVFRRTLAIPFKAMIRRFIENDFKKMLFDILTRQPFRDWTF